MAESAAAKIERTRRDERHFRALLRTKATSGTAEEKKTCTAILDDDNLFAAAFAEHYHKFAKQSGGRLADWIAWLKEHWAEILKFLLSLLVFI